MSQLAELVCELTGSRICNLGPTIQSLWSGYGVIRRATLADGEAIVLKHIDTSDARENRRGWGSDIAHQRKIKSYEIERLFYERYGARCISEARIPRLLAAWKHPSGNEVLLILEDLDASGFSARREHASWPEIEACLGWLASFHAAFLLQEPTELWSVGTYWHLETRPDEYEAMPAGPLKKAASTIDHRLNTARYKTLVHGDAKLANFCFDNSSPNVAAVDFQYVGGGCGMKDLAYFVSSCFQDQEALDQQERILETYFRFLHANLNKRSDLSIDQGALEQEWRSLYPIAWADFCRFLVGWSPGHWKLNHYADLQTQSVLKELGFQ